MSRSSVPTKAMSDGTTNSKNTREAADRSSRARQREHGLGATDQPIDRSIEAGGHRLSALGLYGAKALACLLRAFDRANSRVGEGRSEPLLLVIGVVSVFG